MGKPSPLDIYNSPMPSREELRAVAAANKARIKAYDAARAQFRRENHLCGKCGRKLPPEHTLRTGDCCRVVRKARRSKYGY